MTINLPVHSNTSPPAVEVGKTYNINGQILRVVSIRKAIPDTNSICPGWLAPVEFEPVEVAR